MESKNLPARLQISLRPGRDGPVFKVALITESTIQWLSYDASELTEDEAAAKAASHVPGRAVVWRGRL